MPLPNILVVMADQMRAAAIDLYGGICHAPALCRLARQGLTYEQAFTPHPLCVPARVSVWTGRYPHSHGARRNETWMPETETHAFGLWKERGYHTALIGKNHCFTRADVDRYFDTWCELGHAGVKGVGVCPETKGMAWWREMDAIEAAHAPRKTLMTSGVSPKLAWAATDLPEDDHSTGLIAGQTERFLDKHGQEPFALWVSFPDPHEPYETPRRFFDMLKDTDIPLPPAYSPGQRAKLPERTRLLLEMMEAEEEYSGELQNAIRAYLANILFIDEAVGRILDKLEALGLRENTIVVFCSDHGDFMGDYRMMVKGGVFSDSLTRVPLMLSWPGVLPQNRRVDGLVNLVDLLPTLLRLQGEPVPRRIQGVPLPTRAGERGARAAFAEYGAGGPLYTREELSRLPEPYGYETLLQSLFEREAEGRRKMVRTERWKYVHDPMGGLDELYDLQSDPRELDNLAAEPEQAAIIAELSRLLMDWSIQTEDSRPVPLPGC